MAKQEALLASLDHFKRGRNCVLIRRNFICLDFPLMVGMKHRMLD